MKTISRILVFALAMHLLDAASVVAQKTSTSFDGYIEGQKNFYGFNGNVLIAKEGNIVYQKSFGYSDYDTKTKLDSNSVFDIGSIAKEFTAVGILILKDKGQLSLSDTITKFFPQLPYGNITIRHLLTHTSGMPDGFGLVDRYFDHNKIATNNDLIELLAVKKPALFFPPGEDLRYSGTGFNLLAAVIEKVSGLSYSDYMNEQVFKPLGMDNSTVANYLRSSESLPHYANGFVYNDSLQKYLVPSGEQAWPYNFYGITGEGMMVSTAGDLLKWDRALKNHRLLAAATQQEMLLQQEAKKTVPLVHFGYGMRVEKNELGDCLFHNGYFPGYKCMHIRYVDHDVTVIVLSNNESQSEFIADGLASIALGKQVLQPSNHTGTSVKVSLATYTGKYLVPLTRPPYMAVFPCEIITKDNLLYLHPFTGADIALKAASATTFFYADGSDQQIEFEKDADGNLAKAWHIGWGVKREMQKMK